MGQSLCPVYRAVTQVIQQYTSVSYTGAYTWQHGASRLYGIAYTVCRERVSGGKRQPATRSERATASLGIPIPSQLGLLRVRCDARSSLPRCRACFPSRQVHQPQDQYRARRDASHVSAARRASCRPRTGHEGCPRGRYVVGPEGVTLPSALWKANGALERRPPRPAAPRKVLPKVLTRRGRM